AGARSRPLRRPGRQDGDAPRRGRRRRAPRGPRTRARGEYAPGWRDQRARRQRGRACPARRAPRVRPRARRRAVLGARRPRAAATTGSQVTTGDPPPAPLASSLAGAPVVRIVGFVPNLRRLRASSPPLLALPASGTDTRRNGSRTVLRRPPYHRARACPGTT